MKFENYTIADSLGAGRALLGFAGILLCPGYVAGMATNLFAFRERGLLERMAWSVALSFSTVAIATSLTGHLVGLTDVAGVLWAAVLVAAWLLWRGRGQIHVERDRSTMLLGGFVLFCAIFVIAQLVDVQRGNGLLLSVTVFDQSYRVGFTDAIARTGLPPLNPFYHPGAAVPLRYYYFWYALCALCMKMVHVTARQALMASSVWAGLGLIATIALFARHFLQIRAGLHRYILTSALLLSVTGLDLLPTLWNLFVGHQFAGDLEWWSSDQISSWMDSVLWVPNHVASAICCLTAFLLLWRTQEQDLTRRQRMVAQAFAALAAASAFGLSIYVTAGFGIMMAVWSVHLLRRRQYLLVRRVGVAALRSIVLLLPYLWQMLQAHSGTQQGSSTGPAHMFQFSVRKMIDPELVTALPVLAGLNALHPRLLDQTVRLLLLLPGYALELGFYGAVLVLAWRGRLLLGEARRTALFLAITGLVLVSFVRSAVIGNNDFGYRAAMLPCFFLLLLGGEMIRGIGWKDDGRTPGARAGVLRRLLLLGAAGTAFQAVELRFFVPLHIAAHVAGFEHLPEAALEIRRTYEAAARLLPAGAVIQANPTSPADYYFFVNMLYSGYPMVTDAAADCGSVFGGDPAGCPGTQRALRALFASPAPGAAEAISTCVATGAGYLAVLRDDPAWKDRGGWVWTLPRVTSKTQSEERFRLLRCGAGAQ